VAPPASGDRPAVSRARAESLAALALLGTGVVVVLGWLTGLALLVLLVAHRL
jgi:hypothetical protein